MKKKGAIIDLLLWITLGFFFLVLSVVFLFGFGLVTEALVSIDSTGTNLNISEAATVTFGQINQGLQQLRYWTFFLFLAMGVSILIGNFLVKANPAFFAAYVLVVIISIITSIFISNAYERLLLDSGALQETFQSFVGMSSIMLSLPIWVTVVGLMGAIFLFIGITRDPGQGGSLT